MTEKSGINESLILVTEEELDKAIEFAVARMDEERLHNAPSRDEEEDVYDYILSATDNVNKKYGTFFANSFSRSGE